MPNEAEQWVTYAEEDLAYALVGLEEFPRPAVWSLQQAAEKYLKAVLFHLGKDPPRSHDLLFLLSLIEKSSATDISDAAAELNTFGPARRYPGDMPEITFEEAKIALDAVQILRTWARKKMGLDD